MRTRPILITAAGAGLALTLASCSSSTESGSASSSGPAAVSPSVAGSMTSGTAAPSRTGGSAGDIAFAQMMIPHHEQAIQMADMAATNASSKPVKELAAQIKAAQDPEISQMTQWLEQWGAPATMPSASGSDASSEGATDDMDGMDMGGQSGASGMMSTEDMTKLDTTTGAAFDKMWLEMMITHHEGAIAMAQQVLATTTNPEVKKLATAIVSGQAAEIFTMKQLLAQ